MIPSLDHIVRILWSQPSTILYTATVTRPNLLERDSSRADSDIAYNTNLDTEVQDETFRGRNKVDQAA